MLIAALASGRVANRGRVLATVAAGAVPTAVAVGRGREDLAGVLVVLALATGASLGWAVEDPAAEVLGAAPLAPLRRPARVGWAVALAGILTAVVLLAAGAGWATWTPRLPEAAAAAGLALGAGTVAAQRGNDAALTAVTAGLLGPVVVAALANRWPGVFPGFLPGPLHGRWWWLAGVGVAATIGAGREPFRRRARQEGQTPTEDGERS
jgi:hypothetical protein